MMTGQTSSAHLDVDAVDDPATPINPKFLSAATCAIPSGGIEQLLAFLNEPEDPTNPSIPRFNSDPEAQFRATERLLLQSIASRSQTLGTEYQATLTAVEALATVYLESGRYELAEDHYCRLLTSYEKLYGPDTAWSVMSNLGYLRNKEKRYAEAEGLLRRLLPLLRHGMGKDAPQVVACGNEKLKKVLEGGLGESSPQALGCARHLMEAVAGQGRFEEAEGMVEEELRVVEGMSGEYKDEEVVAMKEMKVMIERSRWETEGVKSELKEED
jgi:tetratricopeptide (TPR) repeat protein